MGELGDAFGEADLCAEAELAGRGFRRGHHVADVAQAVLAGDLGFHRPAAEHPALASFTNGIRQDYQAVRNALTLEWNSGRVEGLNTRTKQLQRQMYGRASFPLLRKRILAS